MKTHWMARFCDLAELIATWSKDSSTKVGCVLVNPGTRAVLATGYNGFPRGVEEAPHERHQRPTKYTYTEHAERNAIYNAARHGQATEGCWAFVNWDPYDSICPDCARAFIQAGVVCVVGPAVSTVQAQAKLEGWRGDCVVSRQMFQEGGIRVVSI